MVISAVEEQHRPPVSSFASDPSAVSLVTYRSFAPLAVAIVPGLVFLAAVANGYVWDDHFNFIANRGYRGLGWEQLTWMFTSAHLAHWIPVTWLTLGFDYSIWGMAPAGYHLTNILFHAANTAVFYLIAWRLLRASAPTTPQAAMVAGGAVAALFFSIHPLRVESVAWITERRDVVSGLFFLLAVLAYLRAWDTGSRTSRWLAISVACFQFGVLAKSIVVTLPVVLLILDIYPLRRLDSSVRSWTTPQNRRIFLEKLPYVPMILLGSFVAISTFGRDGALTSLGSLTPLDRVTMMSYSAAFYVWKTAIPFGLSPLYELPQTISPLAGQFLVANVGTLSLTLLFVILRRRWPAGLAAWLVYLCVLAPVSGAMHNGRHLVADRNTYLACLPWALVVGGALTVALRARFSGIIDRPISGLVSIGVGGWLLMLAVLSSYLTTMWRDDESLWRHAVAVDVRCFSCHHNLGTALMAKGMTVAAIEHFHAAVALRSLSPVPHGALVLAHLASGRPEAAEAELRMVRVLDPELARILSPALLATW
jgi:protein O-mannosyl-transferase